MTNRQQLSHARQLRRVMTAEERRLWYCFLRYYPVKFYKQRPIDKYIVDFYCPTAHLIIELDGSQHYAPDGQQYDAVRSACLQRYGLYVMRFANPDVNQKFNCVCEQIDTYIKEHTANQRHNP